MKVILISLMLMVSSCIVDDDGCDSDGDCKGDRVCRYGECVAPPYTPPPPAKKQCGQVNIGCNCASTTAYPGMITSSTACESGRHQFALCSGTCAYYGSPWYTYCYCN